jgi:tetratricopeptide (TPR) repeat protein
VLLSCAPLSAVRGWPQAQTGDLLPPPRAHLVAVHWPDLGSLEPEVREQLLSARQSLTAVAAAADTPDSALGEAYGLTGRLYHAYSLLAPAAECYQNAQRLQPSDFRWPHALGAIYQQLDRSDEAIASYQTALSLRADDVAALLNIGNIYLQRNRLEEAERTFAAASKLDPKSGAAQYGLGQIALARGDYRAAIEHLNKALALAPAANRIHYVLAMAYKGVGDLDQAREQLAQQGPVGVRVADPLLDGLPALVAGVRIHLLRGHLAAEARRYAEAADEFRNALAAAPDNVTAHVNLGSVLAQMGDTDGAVKEFAAALRVDSANISAHYNLGVLLARNGHHDAAVAHFRLALKIRPTDDQARLLLARELRKSGRTAEALGQFWYLVKVNPDNEDALLGTASLLWKEGRYQEARSSLEEGHTRYPRKGRTAAALAYLLAACPQVELRDGNRALPLAQLVYRATGLVRHGTLIAMALAEQGRCDEAASWQKQMLEAAEKSGQSGILAMLKADLHRYEQLPCRPEVDSRARDQMAPGDDSP